MKLKTGRVAETFELPPLISLNAPRALKFHYQSTAAVPQAVLRQEYPHFYNTVVNHELVTFLPKNQKLLISVGAEFREFAYAPVDKIVSEHHFLWNAKDSQGQTVSTGSYAYDARLRSVFDGFLADQVTPSGVDVILETGVRGLARINNKEQSPFGAGWSLEDLWEIHPNPDGSALVVQGDGRTSHFAKGYGLGLVAGKLDQAGFAGDGGSARQALISGPRGMAATPMGDVVFADRANHRVRAISPSGTIRTIAGTGTPGYSGDGGAATAASLDQPTALATDTSGNIYFIDYGNNVIRRIGPSGLISTVYTSAGPLRGLASTPGGSLYFGEQFPPLVKQISADGGTPVVIAGGGSVGVNAFGRPTVGDGGPAVGAGLSSIGGLAFDAKHNFLYISEGNGLIRRVDCGGLIKTIAWGHTGAKITDDVLGDGTTSVLGDSPLAVDGEGAVYFIAPGPLLRRITMDGYVNTVAGQDVVLGSPLKPLRFFDGSGLQEGSSAALFPSTGQGVVFRIAGLGISPSGDVLIGVESDTSGSGSASYIATAAHTLSKTFFKTPVGDFATLTGPSGGGFQLEEVDRTVRTFNAAGRHTETRDRIGNSIRFTYTPDGLLDTLVDMGGRVNQFAYSGGRVQSVTDGAGRITRFTVDSSGDLVGVLYPNNGQLTYAYQNHLLQSTTTEVGDQTTLAYGPDNMVRTVTEADHGVLTFRPGDSYGLANDLAPAGQINAVPASLLTSSAYEDLFIDTLSHITRYRTDFFGATLREEDPLGRVTQNVRDLNTQPTTRTLPNGNRIFMAYEPRGLLTRREDTGINSVTRSTWSTAFAVTTSTIDPRGNETRQELDDHGNVTKVTFPDQTTEEHTFDARGLVTSSKDRKGARTAYTYDGQGNQITSTHPDGSVRTMTRTPAGYVEEDTDEEGHTTHFVYSEFGLITEQRDAKQGTSTLQYDARRRQISHADELGHVTRMAYDTRDRLVRFESPGGRVQRWTYSTEGLLTSTTDAKQRVTTMDYDAGRQLIRKTEPGNVVTEFLYEAPADCATCSGTGGLLGLITEIKDPLGNEAHYSHDVSGRTTGTMNAIGGLTTIAYDSAGNVFSRTDPDGLGTTMFYDALNRVTRIVDPRTGPTTKGYDANGDLTSEMNAAGQVTEREYDNRRRLVRITVAAGKPEASTLRFQYDRKGNRVGVTTPGGGQWTYRFDELDRLVEAKDPNGRSAFTKYDVAGRVVEVTDRQGLVTQYELNSENERTGIIYADGSRVDQAYDDTGKMTSVADRDVTVQNAFDERDRLVGVTIPQLSRSLTMEYDKNSNRIALSINGARSAYSYDPLNRLITLDHASGAHAGWTYDAIGQVTAKTLPNAVTVALEYSSRRLASMAYKNASGVELQRFSYGYDTIANILSQSDNDGVSGYVYDSQNRLIQASYPGSVGVQRETFSYDAESNRLRRDAFIGSVQTSEVSTFDAADQILSTLVKSSGGGGGTPSPTPAPPPTNFPTPAPTPTETTIPTPPPTPTDTAVPTPTPTPTDTTVPTPPPSFPPPPTPTPPGGGGGGLLTQTITYAHDARGNLTAISTSSSGATTQTTAFTYDVRNRLTGVTLPGGRSIAYAYYPDSPLRLSFTKPGTAPSGGAKTQQLWDPITQNPLQDLDGSNATLVDYIMGNRIDEPLGRVAGGAPHAFITDHLMSVRGLADPTGALVNQYTYAAFGPGRSQVEAVANRLRFTARELDTATGQQYTRNRYLALALGQWSQEDPIGFGGGFNRYTYASANPVMNSDPSGLIAPPVLIGGGLLALLALWTGHCAKVGYDAMNVIMPIAHGNDYMMHVYVGCKLRRAGCYGSADIFGLLWKVGAMLGKNPDWVDIQRDITNTSRGAALAANCPKADCLDLSKGDVSNCCK